MQPEPDKNLSSKAQPFTETGVRSEPIKWYYARWFWGVVVGAYIIPIIYLEMKVLQFKQNVLLSLPRGFTESIYAIFSINPKGILPDFYRYNPSKNYIIYLYIFSLLFYVFLFFLIYEIFKQREIKIKLAFVLVIMLSLTVFGLAMYFLLFAFMS